MIAVLLLGRLVLSGVFLVAGFAKLRDQAGTRQAFLGFGTPAALAKPFAVLLPIAELVVAIGILTASFAWISAMGALTLLATFIVAIGATLARGKTPECHCFGQLHSKPIGWDLLGRNVALALIPAMVISHGPRQPSFLAWAGASNASSGGSVNLFLSLAGIALLILQCWLIFQLIQQGGRVLLRLDAIEKQVAGTVVEGSQPEGLALGEPAPQFELPDLDGSSVTIEQLRSGGKPVMLLFTHPDCGPCTALLPEAARWQRDASAHFSLAIISQGSTDENRLKTKEHQIRTVLLQREHEVSDQYKAQGTPSAVVVRPDGSIGSPVAVGSEAIRSLVSNIINESVAGLVSIQVQEGAVVPPLVFPDLDGKMFNLSQLGGKPAILVFWNPGCGFCQQIAAEVKVWEKNAAKSGTQFLLLSTGTVEANRKEGFRSRTLLDPNFSAGQAFGVAGTPSALRLDEQGRIACKVAVGRQEILESVIAPGTPVVAGN